MQQISPQSKHSLPPDQAAAGLALATHISQSFMPAGTQVDTPGISQNSQIQSTQDQQPDNSKNDAKFTELESKMDTMKAEMEAMIKGEVSSIKDIIIEALKEDGQNE